MSTKTSLPSSSYSCLNIDTGKTYTKVKTIASLSRRRQQTGKTNVGSNLASGFTIVESRESDKNQSTLMGTTARGGSK